MVVHGCIIHLLNFTLYRHTLAAPTGLPSPCQNGFLSTLISCEGRQGCGQQVTFVLVHIFKMLWANTHLKDDMFNSSGSLHSRTLKTSIYRWTALDMYSAKEDISDLILLKPNFLFDPWFMNLTHSLARNSYLVVLKWYYNPLAIFNQS